MKIGEGCRLKALNPQDPKGGRTFGRVRAKGVRRESRLKSPAEKPFWGYRGHLKKREQFRTFLPLNENNDEKTINSNN